MPSPGKGSEQWSYLNVLGILCTHLPVLSNPSELQMTISMFNSGRLLFSHFPLLSPKCSPICNTQDRTNFCPSKNCCHCCYLHESYQVSDKLNYYFLLLLLLFLAEKYLTQLWTKAKRIYSPFSLFATCSGIVRMINSTVQFLDSKHFNSFFNCL